MANQWLRLWHDMPTDPKWRTVARVSKQRIGDVIAVFTHMLVCASNATERGRTQSFNCEDVASALDLDTEQVAAILDAMQGRVLDGDRLKGWEVRQVSREDGGAERSKAWRESKKAAKTPISPVSNTGRTHTERTPNATERNRHGAEREQTPDKDTDTDTDTEEITTHMPPTTVTMAGAVCVALKVEGVGDVNPGNLKLKALIDAGADVGTFVAAVRDVKDSANKRFAYVLGIVKRQMAESAGLAGQALAKPRVQSAGVPVESFSERERRHKREQWEDMTGRKWDDETQAPLTADVIDITPVRIAQ